MYGKGKIISEHLYTKLVIQELWNQSEAREISSDQELSDQRKSQQDCMNLSRNSMSALTVFDRQISVWGPADHTETWRCSFFFPHLPFFTSLTWVLLMPNLWDRQHLLCLRMSPLSPSCLQQSSLGYRWWFDSWRLTAAFEATETQVEVWSLSFPVEENGDSSGTKSKAQS